jgi:hypothetical protein
MSKTGRASENVALFMYHSLEVPIDIIYVSTEHVLVKFWGGVCCTLGCRSPGVWPLAVDYPTSAYNNLQLDLPSSLTK